MNTDLNAALNSATTSGLKKVSKSEMTHKNKALRAGGKVTTKAKSFAKSSVPEVFELDGKKFKVEGQVGKANPKKLTIAGEGFTAGHSVNIWKCTNAVVVINGKTGSILIDSCKKVQILCAEPVVASVEIVNSSGIKVQISKTCPTVTVDKTDGCTVYVSKDCCGDNATKLITSKHSEVNFVAIVGETPSEVPIPEQIVSTFDASGKCHSEFLVHSG